MKKAGLIEDKCDRSPFCGAKMVCPVKAIGFKRKGFFSGSIIIDEDKCIGCRKCISACPHNAIVMK